MLTVAAARRRPPLRRAFALLLACAFAAGAAARPAEAPLPRVAPERAGLSAPRLAQMRDFLAAQAREGAAAGYVLLVARHGKLAFADAIGVRDTATREPMTLDTRFRIASMTKPVTAVAVLMLVEEGRLQLDDPLARYLPEFAAMQVLVGADANGAPRTEPARGPITIRHLLTHTAGLGYGPLFDGPTPLAPLFTEAAPMAQATLAEAVRRIAALPLFAEPGTTWRYSLANDVLGRLVEVVAGQPFDRFLQQRLFDPLGMAHTGFVLPPVGVPLATVYRRDAGGALLPLDPAGGRAAPPVARFPSGGGGLFSTAGDYLRFAQMLANGGSFEGRRYLSPVTVGLMTRNHVAPDALQNYYRKDSEGLGYGFGVGVVFEPLHAPQAALKGDFSWGGYLDTHWLASPQSGLVAVLLSQVSPWPGSPPRRTYTDFRNLLYACLETP